MQILIAPDSFKGTLPATEAAKALAEASRRVFPEAKLLIHPMADGGEGSSSIAGKAIAAKRIELEVHGPEATLVPAFYYLKDELALIEIAAASGYSLSNNPTISAKTANTYGTGELILHAIKHGAKKIYLFLGGSATSDAGTGIARALGAVFFNEKGEKVAKHPEDLFGAEQLAEIVSYDDSILRQQLKGIKVSAIVDVENPLCGPNGAAHVYGPQKGLSKEQVVETETGMKKLASIHSQKTGEDHSNRAGAGAAGGCGFGVTAFCRGNLLPGAAFFLDLIELDKLLPKLDFILTGEGSFDSQSLQGKLIGELINRSKAAKNKTKLLVFAGICDKAVVSKAKSITGDSLYFSATGLDPTISMEKPAFALKEKAIKILTTYQEQA